MTPDVNVLVAASRADHPHHATALTWLTQAMTHAQAHADLKLLGAVVTSFLRLVTHPKVFSVPTPTAQAVAFIDGILASPGTAMLPTHDAWPKLRGLCLDQSLNANALPEAWIAACVLQQQDVLVTFDRDFVGLLPPKRLQLLLPTV
ncbi:MAG: VapC toxin family PIN domain ribonuclease [Rhodoferax sp.]|uniref:TA system VapC family ribonuclease toxin n=1 Tax=Rhodoferax sp. TaxID=50421 RepID=UPI001B67B406|nr:TA system VapC family ribonuclease toxin [Rhodoferax sp.]MBP9904241.1 VapC toxin family PIN domain ribonuclease [Rhodoferax sp.]